MSAYNKLKERYDLATKNNLWSGPLLTEGLDLTAAGPYTTGWSDKTLYKFLGISGHKEEWKCTVLCGLQEA